MLRDDNHVYLSIKGIFNTIPRFKVQGCFCTVHVAQGVIKESERSREVVGFTGCYVFDLRSNATF